MATLTISISSELLARVKELKGERNWSEVARHAIELEIQTMDAITEFKSDGKSIEAARERVRKEMLDKFKDEDQQAWRQAGILFAIEYASHDALNYVVKESEDGGDMLETMQRAISELDGYDYQHVFDELYYDKDGSEELQVLQAEAFVDGAYITAKEILAGL